MVTPADILMGLPGIWPFNQVFTEYYKRTARPLPCPVDFTDPDNSLKISAIFVYNDPRDWGLDSQIILDLLLSKDGVLGTYSEKNGNTSLSNNGWQQDGQPPLFFSNADLFWATSYHLPRLGQGGFQAALTGVWNATTSGANLERNSIGKPFPATYDYAEKVIHKYREHIIRGYGKVMSDAPKLQRVFMVGDNPESDIRGANEFDSPTGIEWTSVLVNTGVHRKGTIPTHTPDAMCEDVLEAVKWALKEEGWPGLEE